VWATGFDPFGPPPVDPWMSLFVAGLLVMGGYCLLPTALAVTTGGRRRHTRR